MVTKQGIIKRISLNAYNTARKGGLIALELNEGDELAWVRLTDGNPVSYTHLDVYKRQTEWQSEVKM